MKILGRILDGRIALSKYNKAFLHDFCLKKENANKVIVIQDRIPESRKQRKYYFGAVLPLLAYLNGWNHRQSKAIDWLHEEMKREFNGSIEKLAGRNVKVSRSTKGLLGENDQEQSGYLERVIGYIEENFGIDRMKVLNPDHYKHFVNEIFSFEDYDDYIDYLVELKLLPKIETHNVFEE